ncbi:MAG: hypothetical protein ACRCYE_11500 [Sarcina sp.]
MLEIGYKEINKSKDLTKDIKIEKAISDTCKAIKIDQAGISKMLRAQNERLDVIAKLIEREYVFSDEPDKLIREINSIMKTLLAYDCLIENKLDTIYRVYRDLN